MNYTDPDARLALIAGLREMAAFLESNPDVPAPLDAVMFVFPELTDTDWERRVAVDAIASLIFTQARETVPGHYVASRFFGPIEYRAVAIDRETERD
jgi:hypothetical protein